MSRQKIKGLTPVVPGSASVSMLDVPSEGGSFPVSGLSSDSDVVTYAAGSYPWEDGSGQSVTVTPSSGVGSISDVVISVPENFTSRSRRMELDFTLDMDPTKQVTVYLSQSYASFYAESAEVIAPTAAGSPFRVYFVTSASSIAAGGSVSGGSKDESLYTYYNSGIDPDNPKRMWVEFLTVQSWNSSTPGNTATLYARFGLLQATVSVSQQADSVVSYTGLGCTTISVTSESGNVEVLDAPYTGVGAINIPITAAETITQTFDDAYLIALYSSGREDHVPLSSLSASRLRVEFAGSSEWSSYLEDSSASVVNSKLTYSFSTTYAGSELRPATSGSVSIRVYYNDQAVGTLSSRVFELPANEKSELVYTSIAAAPLSLYYLDEPVYAGIVATYREEYTSGAANSGRTRFTSPSDITVTQQPYASGFYTLGSNASGYYVSFATPNDLGGAIYYRDSGLAGLDMKFIPTGGTTTCAVAYVGRGFADSGTLYFKVNKSEWTSSSSLPVGQLYLDWTVPSGPSLNSDCGVTTSASGPDSSYFYFSIPCGSYSKMANSLSFGWDEGVVYNWGQSGVFRLEISGANAAAFKSFSFNAAYGTYGTPEDACLMTRV